MGPMSKRREGEGERNGRGGKEKGRGRKGRVGGRGGLPLAVGESGSASDEFLMTDSGAVSQ